MTEIRDGRKKLASKLPDLAVRVFALSGKHYKGCGFHWTLVKTIGYLLHTVNDYDKRYDVETHIVMEVVYEDLLERVQEAERELG